MERFNLDTWLEDKSRNVIDDDGFPVEIIKWDANEKCPVVYLNHNGIAYNVSADGMYDADPNHGLFFAEEESTEFEKELIEFRNKTPLISVHYYENGGKEFIHNYAKKLLDLAREEFIPKKQYEEDLDKAYKNSDKVQFNRGMDEVLNNPQNYFHVGDTIRLKNSNAEYTITSIFNGRYYGEGWSINIIKAADDYELVEDCDEISNNINYSSEIIGFLKNYIKAYGCTAMNSWVKWLNSIKSNHWKPSEEHFRALFYAIEYFKKKKNDTKYLESLYDGLKQL